MAQEGVDIAAIQAKIARLKMLSSAGKISELTSNILDWQTFIKDGMSGLMSQLTSSNQEIHALLEDPQLQKYFETESPELKALLDISKIAASNKVFGKWVAKKVPLIAGVELSINQSYNGLDWLLSFKRMTEANKINGRFCMPPDLSSNTSMKPHGHCRIARGDESSLDHLHARTEMPDV